MALPKITWCIILLVNVISSVPVNSETVVPYPRPGRNSLNSYAKATIKDLKTNDDGHHLQENGPQEAVEVTPNRKSRAIPQKTHALVKPDDNFEDSPVISKMIPDTSKSIYIIPSLRPGRSNYEDKSHSISVHSNIDYGMDNYNKKNSMEESEISQELADSILSEDENLDFVKKYDTMIPMVRFGKRNILPYPRLGRSLGFEMLNKDDNPMDYFNLGKTGEFAEDELDLETTLEDIDLSDINSEESNKLNQLDSAPEYSDSYVNHYLNSRQASRESIIPYPRLGRDDIEMFKRDNRQSMIPQIRFGRSKSRIPGSKDTNEKTDYILPYPRPGRYLKNLEFENDVSLETVGKRQGYMLPIARLGRSDESTETATFDDMSPYGRLSILYPTVKAFSGKYNPKDLKENTSVFIIPYPRPGKRSSYSDILVPSAKFGRGTNLRNKPIDNLKDISGSILPYPRPGKKSYANDLILPYPRPGKKSYGNELVLPYPRLGRAANKIQNKNPSKTSDFIVPYPRPGRNIGAPVLRVKRTSSSFYPYSSYGGADESSINKFLLPYPRQGKSNDKSRFIVPYPRLGRSASNYILPYPRAGRSGAIAADDFYSYPDEIYFSTISKKGTTVVPYPRLGRSKATSSEYIVPYPRLGRSGSENNGTSEGPVIFNTDTVIPYPRLGRSDEESSDEPNTNIPDVRHKLNKHTLTSTSRYILPYPRPGR